MVGRLGGIEPEDLGPGTDQSGGVGQLGKPLGQKGSDKLAVEPFAQVETGEEGRRSNHGSSLGEFGGAVRGRCGFNRFFPTESGPTDGHRTDRHDDGDSPPK
jgi:hypothetical protein